MSEQALIASTLVIAPHPDDETLGCGATIARKVAQGARVWIVIATDGRGSHSVSGAAAEELVQRRRAEALAACAELGVPACDVFFLELLDGHLSGSVPALRAALAELVDRLRPQQILVPASCDGHPDHDVVSGVVQSLVTDAGPDLQVLEYPVWMWQHWPFTRAHVRVTPVARVLIEPVRRLMEHRPLIVPAGDFAETKSRALHCYASQVGPDASAALSEDFVSRLTGRYEYFLPAGSLAHLGGGG